MLAAELLEWLPRAVRLEVADDLVERKFVEAGAPSGALLEQAGRLWRRSRAAAPPTILVVARFPSPAQRRRVLAFARGAGMRFLFVEARSSEARARQRLFARAMSEDEARERLARFRAAALAYRPVNRAERMRLPALSLRRVQSELDEAVACVLSGWMDS